MRRAALLLLVTAACGAPEAGPPFPEGPVSFTAADTTVTLGGTTFGPYALSVDPASKVATARYRAAAEPRVDLVLNLFRQGVWADSSFSARGVADLIRASIPVDSVSSFVRVDPVTADSSFYISRYIGTARDGSAMLAFTRIWNVGGDAAVVTLSRAVAGGGKAREKWAADSLDVWTRQLARLRGDSSWRARFSGAN